MNLTLQTYIAGVEDGSLLPTDIISHYIKKSAADNYNAILRIENEYVEDHLTEFSNRRLHAAPIGIKDNIFVEGTISSCGSTMLENYESPYTATCMQCLEKAGGLMIAKTNMDEFAMGSSGETSAFGPTLNPHDLSRISGGSSSGSAASVAGDLCLASLGSDTGGSIRLPASMCGIVGFKPTYGAVSRYGVQAMSSSLDQVGVLTKTVDDACILLESIAGYDHRDATSADRTLDFSSIEKNVDLSGVRLAYPKQYFSGLEDDRVAHATFAVFEYLRSCGAVVDEIDLPLIEYGVPTYYILCPAEVSTNLGRFDGARFGVQDQTDQYENIQSYYEHMRTKGFGDEVKTRIMMGTHVLSAGFYDAYYAKAQKVRAKMTRQIDDLYGEYDAIIGPTSPSAAWKLGEKVDDPIQMYLADIYTVTANLGGYPAISVPMGTVSEGGTNLPLGFQVMGARRNEAICTRVGKCVENMSE